MLLDINFTMATFVASSSVVMSELDKDGNIKFTQNSDGGKKYTSRMGLDLKRMIDEVAEGIIRVKTPGRRFIAPEQFSISVDYKYPGKTYSTFTNNEIRAELDLWGDFKWKRPKTRMNNHNDIVGSFDEIDWFNDPTYASSLSYPDDAAPIGGFQVFGLNTTSVSKFLKAKPAKRFKLLTKNNDFIWGTGYSGEPLNDNSKKDILGGGDGNDWIFCTSRDVVTGGKGQDTFHLAGYASNGSELPSKDQYDYDPGTPTIITDFDPKQDKIELPQGYKGEPGKGKMHLIKSTKGSFLVGEYWQEYDGIKYSNYSTYADLTGVNPNQKINISWVEDPIRPLSTNI